VSRPTVYGHLLDAMRVGDVIYLPKHTERLDRQISSRIARRPERFKLTNFVAVNVRPEDAHSVLRVERIK
jgi:hypothetical protein